MPSQDSIFTSYLVEISGWDENETFFVEKVFLEWGEEKGKQVQLRHPLRDGAVVFVRLMAPATSNPGIPVAYQAERLPGPGPEGTWEFRLVQLRLHAHTTDRARDLQAATSTLEK